MTVKDSAIGWTGATWNPWKGCTKKSAGCKFCYFYRDARKYKFDPKIIVRTSQENFSKPLKISKEIMAGDRTGHRRLCFTCSWSDFFNAEADEWRPDAWDVMRRSFGVIFMILTKHAERIADNLPGFWDEISPFVWLGVSVENNDNRWRLDELYSTPHTGRRFVSLEPLIGMVDLEGYLIRENQLLLDLVIVGGESGTPTEKIRPMAPGWAKVARDQTLAAGSAFFYKQHGNYIPLHWNQYNRANPNQIAINLYGEVIKPSLRVRKTRRYYLMERVYHRGNPKNDMLDGVIYHQWPELPPVNRPIQKELL